MSGGVDSSVSAVLLKKAGYDVTGVFIKVWQPDWINCTWKEDRLDAMRVAAQLEIPFVTLDLEKEYKKEVVDYMIREYKAGVTPNPDVMCNKAIKFGSFYDWAMSQGADFVATGHYARIVRHGTRNMEHGTIEENHNAMCYELCVACDSNKDQTYFLWNLKRQQLAHMLFPIGHLDKPDVRRFAKKFNLATADKKDSQGLCFIGKVDMKEFLSHYLHLKKGKVLNERGEIIGEHDGSELFTIGERHGYLINKKTPNDRPQYVVAKNIRENSITVSPNPLKISSGDRKIFLKNENWISNEPVQGKKYLARIRYRQPLEECEVPKEGKSWSVNFTKSQKAISAGQSAVIYDGEICMGGGIIL